MNKFSFKNDISANYLIVEDIKYCLKVQGYINKIDGKYIISPVKNSPLIQYLDSNKLKNDKLNIYKYDELPILPDNFKIKLNI